MSVSAILARVFVVFSWVFYSLGLKFTGKMNLNDFSFVRSAVICQSLCQNFPLTVLHGLNLIE